MMNTVKRFEAVQALSPGAQFVMVEDTITEWHSPSIPQPTDAEIDAKLAELIAEAPRKAMSLTFAQLLIGLVAEQWITEAEGEAWLAGTLPASVLSLIATLPADQQFPAKARALRPSIVERLDPLVIALGQAQGKTPEELDTFFLTYANA
jgi:hypothetical protein